MSICKTNRSGYAAWCIGIFILLALCFDPPDLYSGNPCEGLRTQTMGGWGQKASGNNPGAYRDAHFQLAFPDGLTIGCAGGYTLSLGSASAVEAFLPSGGQPSILDDHYIDPGGSYHNNFAGQLIALGLSIGFDRYDSEFASSLLSLHAQLIASGPFAGWTIEELWMEANLVIGGCSSSYSVEQLHEAATLINENFVDGEQDNGYITSTPGRIALEASVYPPIIFYNGQEVVHSYRLSNLGSSPLYSPDLYQTVCSPEMISGDVDANSMLDPGETWEFECSNSYELLIAWVGHSQPQVSAMDVCGLESTASDETFIYSIVINMDLMSDRDFALPGDTLDIKLVTRMISGLELEPHEDLQFYELGFSCNLIQDGSPQLAGPQSPWWADPGGDYINTGAGAINPALDYDDYVDYDNGLQAADWVHAFEYIVPPQSGPLLITASDFGKFRYYDGTAWQSDSLVPGVDSLYINIGNYQMAVSDESMEDIFKRDDLKAGPNPATDELIFESSKYDRFSLLDSRGRLISTGGFKLKHRLDLRGFPGGMYYLQVSDGNESNTIPVLKK